MVPESRTKPDGADARPRESDGPSRDLAALVQAAKH
jgi:hypothetical protein